MMVRYCRFASLTLTLTVISIALLTSPHLMLGQNEPKCGPVPLSICHELPKCTYDGWETGKPLKAGTGCSTRSGIEGQCDGEGTCKPLPQVKTGSMTPAYYLITILYAPPGAKSKASYTTGSTAGTTTSVSTAFSNGIKAGITGNVILTADYQVSTQNTESFQVTKTVANILDINSVNDTIQHGQDLFYIWVSPVLNYSQVPAPGMPVNLSFASAPSATNIVQLTANELAQPQTIASWKQPLIKNFTQSDFAQMASTDPWLSSGYQLDPNRYVPVGQLQLDGPDQAGDYPGQGASVSDSQVNCHTGATSTKIGVDWGFTSGPELFGQEEKATVVESLSWTSTSSVGNCNGSTQTALVDLATPTVDYHDVIDVYEDSVYHTFAYVSESGGAGFHADIADISGTLKDSAGKALANQSILIKFANGKTRTVFTNAQGVYRIFQVPPGKLQITAHNQSGDIVRTITFKKGKRIVQELNTRAQ